MKLHLFLTLLIVTLLSLNSYAQQPVDCGQPSPPGEDNCGDACVYCDLTANGYTGSTIGYTDAPVNFPCGTIENNQWFAFAAGTTTVEFTIDAYNCMFGDGVQGAIYTSCNTNSAPIVCNGGNNNGEDIDIVVTAENLVIGEIYWFMIDGWAGDACDYDVTVTDGNTDPPPLDPPGPITPMVSGCAGETVTFMVPDLDGASYYEWVLPDGTVVTGEDPFVDYTFGSGGQVCVTANNVCNFSEQVCITIDAVIPDAGTITAPNPLCPGEIADISVNGFNADPEFTQAILITDASGTIIEIINGSTGTFTSPTCDNFQICTYNYTAGSITPPVVGDNVNSINCVNACCDLNCQNLSFEDTQSPVFSNPPGDLSYTCFDQIPPMSDLEWTDNCDGTGMVTGQESGDANTCDGGTINRTWTYTDMCGNEGTHTQTISVDPAPIATFENPPGDMTVDCENIPTSAPDLFYTNNGSGACLATGTVSPVESGGGDICGGTITYTWDTTDPCGNPISHTQNITITPAPAPQFVNPPADMTVDCDNVPTGGQILSYTNSAFGPCLIDGIVHPVESGNADICGGTITYTWDFTDACGNNINHTQNITVEPAPAPQFLNPPADLTVTCDNIPMGATDLSYTNNALGSCLISGTISPTQSGTPDLCGSTVTYTWEFVDQCGNDITHVQNITIEPAPLAQYLNPPGDLTVTCDNIPTGANDLSYTNNAIGACLIEGDVSPVETGSADICGGTITYTWGFTDDCGNDLIHVQNITVEPAPPPVFMNPPTDMNVSCGSVPPSPQDLNYSNNGVGACLVEGAVTAVQSGSYDECGGTITNTWSYTDPCGETITHTQNIVVDPAPPATFTSALPQDMTVDCNAVPGGPGALSYSNGESGECEIAGAVGATMNGGFDECGGTIQYRWMFTDACGRSISHIQVITVLPAPPAAFLDLPGPITLACSDVSSTPPSIGYSNGGSGLCVITGNVQAIQSGSYNSCGGNISYTWTFTDDCNRTISHVQNVTVEPAADPYFVDLPMDLTIDCGEFFPPPVNLGYTNDETGNCGINGSVSASVTVINDLEQEYMWTFTNPCNGATISHTQHITQNPTPEITIDPYSTVICLGESFDLSSINVTDLNFTNPTITYHNGTPAGPGNQIPSPIVSPGSSTTYYILATNPFDCSDELSFDLVIEEPPNAGMDGFGNICYSIPNNINLFDYLGGTPDQTGYWGDLSGMGVDVSNPYNVNLAPFPPGQFVFEYVVPALGVCPDITALVTLEFLPEISIDILEIGCSDDPDFYEVLVNTNGFDITVSGGEVTDIGGGQISITEIPIDVSLTIAASNPDQFQCIQVIPISPPDCNCPNVDPPVNDGDEEICEGEAIPELSVSVGPGETANWYDAPSGGNLLIGESLTFTPIDSTAPGIYTFYVEAENIDDGCLSSVLTPVQLTIFENPTGNDALLELCDDDDDGYVSFDLTVAEPQIYTIAGTVFTYFETLDDAENGTNSILSPYTNTSTPSQILFVVLTSPEGCSDQVELTLTVLPLPDIELDIQNETCLGENDGSVTIISNNGSNYSLDGINWETNNTFADLAAGAYTAYVEDLNGCVSSLDFMIEPGLELILNDYALICDNNGTASDATDDFYTITFIVENNQGITGTYTINEGSNNLGAFEYGNAVSLEILAEDQSLVLTFSDDLLNCLITQDIGPLNSCSTDCSISFDDFEINCSDNGTASDATDDFYTITLTASAINGAANNTYNVLIDGTITYNFVYGVSNEFELPADNSSPTITIVDNADQACLAIQNIGPLIPCSDACIIVAELGMIECNNEGTENDPLDDTYTFDVTLSGVNTAMGWQTDDGAFSGDYGTVVTLGPFLISEGMVEVTFVDNNDMACTTTISVDAPQACSLCSPTLDAGPDGLITCENESANLIGTSSEPGIYTWLGPNTFEANTLSITVYEGGWYVLQGEYGGTCIVLDSAYVDENLSLPTADAGDGATITCQSTDVLLMGTGSTSSGNTSYQWINQGGVEVGNTPEVTVSEVGTYTFIVTDTLNGCTASAQVDVTPDADLPIADAGPEGVLDCVTSIVLLDGSASTDSTNISYEWIDENNIVISTNITHEVSTPGVYTLNVINDDNECEASASVEVTEDLLAPIADAGPNGTINCDTSEVNLIGSNSSGLGVLTYEWQNPAGDSIANTSEITVSESGIYTLIITDSANGCTASAEVEVTSEGDLPEPQVEVDGVLDCSGNLVLLDGSTSSGNGMLSYEWFDPSGSSISEEESIAVEVSGTYLLIITDGSNGCTAQASGLVETSLDVPIADAGPNAFINCDTSEVNLSGSNSSGLGALEYIWQNPAGDSIANTSEITVAESGVYTLIITDSANGCTAMAQTQVTENGDLPTPDVLIDGILNCNEFEVVLDGSGSNGVGDLSYEWLDPTGVSISEEVSVIVESPGNYTLIITDDANGCSAQSTGLVVENNETPNAVAESDGDIDCSNSAVLLDGSNSSGGDSLLYQWFTESGVEISNEISDTVNASGTYQLVITDLLSNCSDSSIVNVAENPEVPILMTTGGTLSCQDSVVVLDGSGTTGVGSLLFEWQDVGQNVLSDSMLLEVNEAGDYTLIVTDNSNGCSAQIIIPVPANFNEPTAVAEVSSSLDCTIDEVFLDGTDSDGSGDLSFQWLNENNVLLGIDSIISVGSAGNYTLIVTDGANGCSSETSTTVLQNPDLPEIDIQTPEILTCDLSIISLVSNLVSGSDSLAYSWYNEMDELIGDSTFVEVSMAGVYSLVLTDLSNGCSTTEMITVLENTLAPNADAGLESTLTCTQTMTTLDAGNSTGSGSLEYEWFDNNSSSIGDTFVVQVSAPGIYTVIVTDENGCTDQDQVEVFISTDTPTADAGADYIIDCNNNQFTLGGLNTSTGTNIVYEWQDQNGITIGNEINLETDSAGTYTLIVTNTDNNCTIMDEVVVDENLLEPIADAGFGGTLTCDINNLIIGGTGTSDGLEYSYEWQNSMGEIMGDEIELEVSEPDTFILIVSNTVNGCSAQSEVIVLENIEEPTANAGDNTTLTCEETTTILDGSLSSGDNISFEWYDPNSILISDTSTVEVGGSGIYILIVTNEENGCTDQSSVEISQDNNLPQIEALVSDLLTCTTDSVFLDGSGSISQSGFTVFEWVEEGTQNIISTQEMVSVNTPGTYTLTILDSINGCTATTSVEVFQNIDQPIVDAGENAILTCNDASVQLSGSASNGNVFEYEWFDDNAISVGNTPAVDVVSAGVYTLLITNLENGCTSSATVEVFPDNTVPTSVAIVDDILTCTTNEVLLESTGSSSGINVIYQWEDASGMLISEEESVIVSNPGVYTLIVIDTTNNCTSQDDVLVIQDIADPTAFINSIGALNCTDQSLVLDGTGSAPFGDLSFEWSTINGNINSGENTPNPEIDEPGDYVLIVTNNLNGCTNTTTITIEEDITPPTVFINAPEILTCSTTEILINASGSSTNGNFEYSWVSNPAGGIVSGATTLMPTVNQAGTYTLYILNQDNGCENDLAVVVDEDVEVPTAMTAADDELDCITMSIPLDGSGSSLGSSFNYLWSGSGIIDDENTLQPTVYTGGIYTLLVTNIENGCTATSEVLVNQNDNIPQGLDVQMNPPLCAGDRGSLEILEVIGGTPPYLYSIDGGTNFYSFSVFEYLQPGNYDVLIQDAIGCEYGEMISIPEIPLMLVDLGADILIELGSSAQLNVLVNIPLAQIDTIVWSPTTNLSCVDCLDPIASPLNETWYQVQVTDINDCMAEDQIILRVRKDLDVYIPNVFSPHNLDGNNDIFMIYSGLDDIVEINTFQVFDRWGELVFEDYNFLPNNPAHGWDGTLKGEKMNPAVFVYWAEITFIDGATILYKGDVTLVR